MKLHPTWSSCLRNSNYVIFLLKDDVLLFDYNVQERVNDFVAAALAQVRSDYPENHVLYLFLHLIP